MNDGMINCCEPYLGFTKFNAIQSIKFKENGRELVVLTENLKSFNYSNSGCDMSFDFCFGAEEFIKLLQGMDNFSLEILAISQAGSVEITALAGISIVEVSVDGSDFSLSISIFFKTAPKRAYVSTSDARADYFKILEPTGSLHE